MPSAAHPQGLEYGQPVRIGIVSDIMDYAMFWYCEHADLFHAHGLRAEVTVTYSVPGATEGLRSGEFDIAVSAPESVLAQAGPGSELVMLGGTTHRLLLSLMGSPKVRTIAELRGGLLGASSATEGTALLMLEMLRSAGVPADSVQIVPIGVGEVRLHALLEGSIDAGILNVPVSYEGVEQGLTMLGAVADVIPEYQFVTVNARRAWLHHPGNADTARRVLRTLTAATQAIYDPGNSELMTDLVRRKMQVGEAAAAKGWRDFLAVRPIASDLKVSETAMDKTLMTMRQAGTLGRGTNARWTDAYLDPARNWAP